MSQIEAKIIADSISPWGTRLTTFQLKYHRYIHGELLTHRMFSRNASSSRAIPVRKILSQVWKDPAIPIHWGKNQSGMQSDGQISKRRRRVARFLWKTAGKFACIFSWGLMKLGIHKEVANRILEPWQFMHTVVTATDFDNFFILRDHPDAQPEIQELARQMKQALRRSSPTLLNSGEFHLPYVLPEEVERYKGTDNEWLLPVLSTARCARVSYMNHDGTNPSVDRDKKLFERLVISTPAHASPAEHQAQATSNPERSRNFSSGWKQFREIVELDGWGPYEPVGSTVQQG